MDLSLPLLTPFDTHTPWLRPSSRPRSPSPPPTTPRQRQQRDDEKRHLHARSALALLAADEAAIAHRKAAVGAFGAQWIRPPGVPKTLQAMTEEQLEREEQAELERQEAGLRDMQAQQQLAEARRQAQAGEGGEGEEEQEEEMEEEERDLDDEIPDADADGDGDGTTTTADITFNEESMVEGSQMQGTPGDEGEDEEGVEQYGEMEEAELTGAAQVEEELGLERDLDDSVPEAGSYQHTDTEIEDSDSDSEIQSSFIPRPAPRSSARRQQANSSQMAAAPQQGMMSLQERMRAQVNAADSLARSPGSLNLSSSVLDTSGLLESSPVMQRTNGGEARRRGGRSRRGRRS